MYNQYAYIIQTASVSEMPCTIRPFSIPEFIDHRYIPRKNEPIVVGGLYRRCCGERFGFRVTLLERRNKRICGRSLFISGTSHDDMSESSFSTLNMRDVRQVYMPQRILYCAEVDARLITPDANQEQLNQVFTYVLSYISAEEDDL